MGLKPIQNYSPCKQAYPFLPLRQAGPSHGSAGHGYARDYTREGFPRPRSTMIGSGSVSELATTQKLARPVNTSAFKGSNERLSRVDSCKDEGHSDAASIKRVTSSSEGDCFVFSMKKGSLSAATKSRI